MGNVGLNVATPEDFINDAELIRMFAKKRDEDAGGNLDKVWLPIYHRLQEQKEKFLEKEDLVKIVCWKVKEHKKTAKERAKSNDDHKVRSITKIVFNLQDENTHEDILDEIRIEILTLLKGVQIPVASAILTVLDPQRYTIIDKCVRKVINDIQIFREIEWKDTASKRWVQYCKICRLKAKVLDVSLRDFDKALWQYGKSMGC